MQHAGWIESTRLYNMPSIISNTIISTNISQIENETEIRRII